MTYNVSKPINDLLKSYVEDNYQTYVDIIATANAVTLKALTSVEIGGTVAVHKTHEKPYMIIEPIGEDVTDTLPGQIESTIRYDVLIEADGYQEDDALTLVGLYKDAFCSMVFSDDTLGGEVDHASVTNIEQYPGGSGTSKYIMIAVEITVSQGR